MPEPLIQGGPLGAQRRTVAQIEPAQRQAMLGLLQAHFDGVDASAFQADLDDKQGAILLVDAGGALRGFSTWTFYDTLVGFERLRVACFGDTIVAREAWGSPALPAAVIQLLMGEAARVAPQRLFSLLICAGARTYRFMPFFCEHYVPRADADAPLLALRGALALQRFGAQYDAATGIVRLQRGAYALKQELAEQGGMDEHDRYFFAANPAWRRGEELVCLAEMKADNLTAAARRLLRGAP